MKMSRLGFSKQFLKWTLSYVTDRRQFVQIDDKLSNMTAVKFGVPQGSILGPVLFNIYVADLQSELSTKGYQYADDTTLYIHAKPKNLEFLQKTTGDTLSQLSDWSDRNSLALNSTKTKLMIISTREMSAKHNLKDFKPEIYIKGKKLDRTDTCKLLGVHLNDHLTWDNHTKIISGSCYGTLAILKKLKKMAPFNLRKQLAESLILSKIDYGDQVYTPLTVAQHKRLQKVQFAAASFVTGNYVKDSKTILKLGWLPIKERRELNLLKTTFKAMNYESWPTHLTLEEKKSARELRSSSARSLVIPREAGTFQDSAAKLFNSLPENIRNCRIYSKFLTLSKDFLKNKIVT